jgi:hypothetical protein
MQPDAWIGDSNRRRKLDGGVMRCIDRSNLSTERLAEIEGNLPQEPAIGVVLQWAYRNGVDPASTEVVQQDEYTFDIILPWKEELFLVLDGT